jgi:predicted DNA binding CopG/RHH family protein
MNSKNLSKDEKYVLSAFEDGEYVSDFNEERREYLKGVAEATFKKDKRINIRLSARDLEAIQRYAIKEGIPYQTLVSSILHKFVSGGLQEVPANNKLKKDAQKKRVS